MMKPLIIVNFECVETTSFLVIELYGTDGCLAEVIAFPLYKTANYHVISLCRELATKHDFDTFELWTKEPELFKFALLAIGITPAIKHESDVSSTKHYIERHRDVLAQFYGIEPLESEDVSNVEIVDVSKWRLLTIRLLEKLIYYLKESKRK